MSFLIAGNVIVNKLFVLSYLAILINRITNPFFELWFNSVLCYLLAFFHFILFVQALSLRSVLCSI